jgi:hypothetical protein
MYTRLRWTWTRRSRAPAALVTALVAGGIATLGGCSDSAARAPTAPPTVSANKSGGRGLFHRYVALGTAVSMGWTSFGVSAESQAASWPAQLARLAGRELSEPLFAGNGCPPPDPAPLIDTPPVASGPCELQAGVDLPTGNLALRGATVSSALFASPANIVGDSGFGFSSYLPRVLSDGLTQVTAMRGLNPKIVSVEYGFTELARRLYRNSTFPGEPNAYNLSVTAWAALYDQLLDSVAKSSDYVVLAVPYLPEAGYVGMQLFSPEVLLTRYNVLLPFLCWDINLTRSLYVPAVASLARAGLAARVRGEGPVTFDCSDLFFRTSSISLDTRQELELRAGWLRQHVFQQAVLRGFAVFDMSVLYTLSARVTPSDLIQALESPEPFGPYLSADGLHPSAAGNRLLAEAAARALNETYGLDIAVPASADRRAR